jgi:RNA polymerase sigma-70 factor, ECF subfamily
VSDFSFFFAKVVDSKLNIRLKEGSPSAYEELFKQTFPRLLGYCRLFVHDQAQSNDLVQECFVKLWEKRSTIKPSQSVESLLFVMLRNRCLNYLRDLKIQMGDQNIGFIEENDLQHLYQLDFTGNEEKLLEEKLIEAIQQSIEKLPEKRKLVFTKTKIEGRMNKDVADELCISVKAVEKHLHQAKVQIRQEVLLKFPLLTVLIAMLLK